jgi:hypothetical protein
VASHDARFLEDIGVDRVVEVGAADPAAEHAAAQAGDAGVGQT